MTTKSALAARLRVETAPLHLAAEEKVGLPDSVRTRADYAALLRRLLSFHCAFEDAMAMPIWSEDWSGIGITLGEHVRSPLLIHDLSNFNQTTESGAEEEHVAPHFYTFAEALGGLYVIEGSSLGGKILTPIFRALLGDIPTRFYEGYGRNHPQPWRSVLTALARFDEEAGDTDNVIKGAVTTFNSFGDYLAATHRRKR